jgi:DNA-binding protein HU-beta
LADDRRSPELTTILIRSKVALPDEQSSRPPKEFPSMNRNQLIANVAEETGLSAQQAAGAVAATLEGIAKGVAAGEQVALSGFGTFERRQRAARAGRNPQTGEPIEIAASVAPAFKPATAFRRLVAG